MGQNGNPSYPPPGLLKLWEYTKRYTFFRNSTIFA